MKSAPRNTAAPLSPQGARLRFLRQLAGLRQNDIAHAIKCSAVRISLIERGAGCFSPAEVIVVARLIGCDPEGLQ